MKRVLLIVIWFVINYVAYAQQDTTYISDTTEIFTKYELLINKKYNQYSEALNKPDTLALRELEEDLATSLSVMNQEDRIAFDVHLKEDLIKTYDSHDYDSFIIKAERSLYLLSENDESRFDILTTMADIFSSRKNKEMLEYVVSRMEELPDANSEEKSKQIQYYSDKCGQLLPFDSGLYGYWVSNISLKKTSQPYLIIKIDEIDDEPVASIMPISAINSGSLQDKSSLIRYSNIYNRDYRRRVFKFDFYNNTVKKGNMLVSGTLSDWSRTTRASVSSLLSTGKPSLGQTLATSFLGELTAGFLDLFAEEAAMSKVVDEVIYLSGYTISENKLSTNFLYQQQLVKIGETEPYTTALVDKNQELWRWRPEYDVVFADEDANPVSPYVTKLNKTMELYKIKKKTSFWSYKYGGVTLGSIYLGIGIAAAGILFIAGKKRPALGTCLLLGGLTMTIGIPIWNNKVRHRNRAKAISLYNASQYKKFYETYVKGKE